MTLSLPPRSLPPPAPPKVAAQTRIKTLRADVDALASATARAALQFEIAALHETQLDDRARALALYEEAALTDPGFRPPLFAMARLLREDGHVPRLVSVLEALVHAAKTPADAAMSLVELGVVLADQLQDFDGARRQFEQALARDPSHRAAALMLERVQRAAGEADAATRTLRTRLASTQDASLAAVLAWEVAEHEAASGRIDDAIATLLAAASTPLHRYASLERVARLARLHARHSVAAQALDDMTERLVAYTRGEAFDGRDEIAALFANLDACRSTIAWQQREVGRLRALLGDAEGSVRAYERAHEHAPSEVLIALEFMYACEAVGDTARADSLVTALLPLADPERAAVLYFHSAELAQSAGHRDEALAQLDAALQADPSSPAALAVLEDALIDSGALDALIERLRTRAGQANETERRALLERAAVLAAGPARRSSLALELYRALIERSPDAIELVRDMYGVALRAREPSALLYATQRLSECGVDDHEGSALLWQRYDLLLQAGDPQGARTVLEGALIDPRCERWAPTVTVVHAALHHDHDLLQRAHARLSELANTPERCAAHLCAQARALLRMGRSSPAIEALQHALRQNPGNAYAVALLEELLHAQGDSTEAVYLLREAAAAAVDARRGELALLHAGAMAEAAGNAELAARSYEEAADLDPDALSPLWALRRVAERTDNRSLELTALEGLCERQSKHDAADLERLELAALYDLMDQPGLAAAPLRAALSGELGALTGSAAMLGASTEIDPKLRFDAYATLQRMTDGATRLRVLREHAAHLSLRGDTEAEDALAQLAEEGQLSAAEHLSSFLWSHEGTDRANALRGLADTLDDADARAELLLHARRITNRTTASTDDEALVEAIATYEEAPSALAAAVALGEALSPSDDAELRVRALESRLSHVQADATPNLSLALARALLEAHRAEDAVRILTKLIERDANDLCAWEALRVAARMTDDVATVVRACDTLALRCEGELRALLLEESATLLEERLDRPDMAEARLRAALASDDARSSAFERLHDLVLQRGAYEELAALVSDRLRVAAGNDERIDLLYEHARLLRGLGHREAALARIDELLALAPSHAGALGLAAEIHASLRSWMSAVEALRALGHADAPAAQRKLARRGAADFLERHLHDVRAAYGELELLSQDGLADLGTWKRMADLAQRANLLPQAIQAVSQAAKLSSGQARAVLERRAAELLSRNPEDREAARQAWKRALAAWPSDIDACEGLHALSEPDERAQLLTTFSAQVLATLGKDPDNAPELRALRRAALLAGDRTLEHVTLCALVALDLASSEELTARDRLDAAMPSEPNEPWTEEHLAALRDPSVSDAAWRFARIACKAWLDLTDDTPTRYGVTKHDRIAKQADSDLRRALASWTQSFGLEVADLYLGGAGARALTMVLQPGHAQAWVLGKEVQAPLDKLSRLHVAQQCAATWLGVLPLLRQDKGAARDILLATWFAVVPSSTPEAERLAPLSQQLARRLSRAQRADIEQCIAGLPDPLRALEALLDGAIEFCLRVGMVAAGDPGLAMAVAHGRRAGDGAPLATSPRALSLLRFWTSNTLVSLRRELGLNP